MATDCTRVAKFGDTVLVFKVFEIYMYIYIKKSIPFHRIYGDLSLLPVTTEIQSGVITHWSKLVKTSKIINYLLFF